MKVSLVFVICLFGVAQSGGLAKDVVADFVENAIKDAVNDAIFIEEVQNVGQSGQMVDQRKDSLDSRSQTVESTQESHEDLDEVLSDFGDLSLKIEYELLKFTNEGEEESLKARIIFKTCREGIRISEERPENVEEDFLSMSTEECNLYKPDELADMLISYLAEDLRNTVQSCDMIDEETKAKVNEALKVDETQVSGISNFLAVVSGESLQLTQEKSKTLKKLHAFAVKKIKEICSKTEHIVEANAI